MMSSKVSRRRLLTFDIASRASPAVSPPRWLRVHRTAMACRFEVTLLAEDAAHVDAARVALDEADRVEALLTVFRPESELSRVNQRAADGFPVDDVVDEELWALLGRAAGLHDRTDGAFDITSTPLSRCWGFFHRSGALPSDEAIASARELVGMSGVAFEGPRRIRFGRPGVELNLNAIGKGYALDRMGAVLRRRGVSRALVSGGRSSVLAVGGPADGWPIDLESPQTRRPRLGRIYLRDGALGTSGAGEQFVVVDGTRYGHVIDPRSGRPARGVLSASVITTDAAAADALSTAFLVGGPDLAARYCREHADTLALLTLDDGTDRTRVFGSYAGASVELRAR
jgi:thiamine biosynthesis lipoprotein